jgi:hypothetical protein
MADVIHLAKADKPPREPNSIVLVSKNNHDFNEKVHKRTGQMTIDAHCIKIDLIIKDLQNKKDIKTIYVIGHSQA